MLDNYWAQISTTEGRMIMTLERTSDGEYVWIGKCVNRRARERANTTHASLGEALLALGASYGSDVWELEVWNGREQIWP